MEEMDSLLDSLIEQRKASEVSYIDEKYAKVLELKQVPSKGQGMFAAQSLSVRDPICSLGCPTMMAIDSDFLPTTCYHCLIITATGLPIQSYGHASIDLKTCNGCFSARFCNRDCQIKAWHAYHKHECKIFKKLRDNMLPAFLRAVLRIVLLKDRDKVPGEEWDRITSLTSHEQFLAARGRSNLTDMAEGIKHLAQSGMSVDMIQRLIFIMKSNAIELPTPIHAGIGVMLDPLIAKLNHSCEPNISVHRPQHTMASGWMESTQLSEDARKTFAHIVPLRDIQEGEELLNCYVAPTVAVDARRTKLREEYFFECNCPKCQSDASAIADLTKEQPRLPAQFQKWTKDVIRNIAQLERNPQALQKAAVAMDKSEAYLEYPVLYTTGDFPEIALRLILEGLKRQACDEALIDILRIYFLVNPARFVGRHNPTNLYTVFLMLDIFDVVMGISTPSWVTDEKVQNWLRSLSDRGLSKSGLVYWRRRICTDLRKRIEGSAVKDLLVLIGKREEQLQDQDATGDELKKSAEQEMRAALRLKEPRWQIVLQTNGC